jgi:DNA uptake protein ComE-like DNA-binding protein
MSPEDRNDTQNATSASWADQLIGFLSTAQGKVIAATAVVAIAGVAYKLYNAPPAEGSLVVNVNTATEQEIETIPKIGAARAALIIAGRPYTSVDDLLRVKGIGRKTLDDVRPYIKVAGDTEKRSQ